MENQDSPSKPLWLQRSLKFLSASVAFLTLMGLYHSYKPLPRGLGIVSPWHPSQNAQLLVDSTYTDTQGQRHSEQAIFNEVLRLIGQAEQMIVLDMFLFNAYQGAKPETTRALSQELTQALIKRKQAKPQLEILVISDPLNTLYGGLISPEFEALKREGIEVILTNLSVLRDSNPSWSVFWRMGPQAFGNNPETGWLPSPVGPGKVTLRSYFALLNFKANHRKTLVVDEGKQWTGLVTTANPHDGSSAHDNLALKFHGPAVADLFQSELAVAQFSGATVWPQMPQISSPTNSTAQIQVLTEGGIWDSLLQTIAKTQRGDKIQMAIFYFSHRPLILALLAAQARGVQVEVLMDPNKDAFGREKNGVPNRQVAYELTQNQIPVRWCDTHGEQCHSKMTLITHPNQSNLFVGSANYTRRNLDHLNLETSVHYQAAPQDPVIQDAQAFFRQRWENQAGKRFSTDYSVFADESWLKYWQYRVMEWSGWSTF